MDYSVYNFVKATKNEIRPTSAAFEEFLIACNNLVATSRIGNEVIKNFSSEVRLDVAFKLHDIDENW